MLERQKLDKGFPEGKDGPFQFHIRRSKFKGQTTQDSWLSISVLKVIRSLTILVNKVFLKNIFRNFLLVSCWTEIICKSFIGYQLLLFHWTFPSLFQLRHFFSYFGFFNKFPHRRLTNSCLLSVATICTLNDFSAIVITGHFLVIFWLIKSKLSTERKHLHLQIYEISCTCI